ncbi:ATP synthase F0, B subunit [Thermaerobacter marianensis DSM 12885]|uniref:ATP synthase subunit b n=1 Tax=Thermaerobacter marianensis (strain ATCC 700841 / DSM 12885 / JCM 10246 / 7p75a) TaxID=644966 RepID=E6SLM3_THEM7|nr:F0F1 ATP synthase subunit B [Thermaerobacter marianensis]ADU50290.1 ATP synthase F0, B subunit [Thermaerobacter marianensis DSM 12885]
MQISPELIWAFINFFVFVILMTVFFWRPMLELLDRRREEIEANLAAAERAREEAARSEAEYRQRLAAAQREAQSILERATQLAEEERQQRLEAARREAEQLLERARATIEREKEQAIAALRREVADLTLLATERVLGRALDADDQRRLVAEAVEEVANLR